MYVCGVTALAAMKHCALCFQNPLPNHTRQSREESPGPPAPRQDPAWVQLEKGRNSTLEKRL